MPVQSVALEKIGFEATQRLIREAREQPDAFLMQRMEARCSYCPHAEHGYRGRVLIAMEQHFFQKHHEIAPRNPAKVRRPRALPEPGEPDPLAPKHVPREERDQMDQWPMRALLTERHYRLVRETSAGLVVYQDKQGGQVQLGRERWRAFNPFGRFLNHGTSKSALEKFLGQQE